MYSSPFRYTDERNVQIVIALLKLHGIRRVIVSPGATNMTFVASIQNDPWFQIWSSVDERSAAYIACGMAAETNEPVVLSCTGATASRNYMPGLTEAYYRKLPILAITSTRGNDKIGHLIDQQIDRRNLPNDIVLESVTIGTVHNKTDERVAEVNVNKAILALKLYGGGPSHINLSTSYSSNLNVMEIPPVHAIYRHFLEDESWPELPLEGPIAIFIGSHKNFTEKETFAIDLFCATNNAVVFCDHTSGYRGKYEVHYQLVAGQKVFKSELPPPHLCIHIGEVSGDQFHLYFENVWRVSPDGQLRDTWGTLRRVFMMREEDFFMHYAKVGSNCKKYHESLEMEVASIQDRIPELPFSNVWIAQYLVDKLPPKSELHLGIYNTLRSWNFFKLPSSILCKCNVGGFGIDGGLSSMIGSSFINPNKIYICVLGDLAFFYDMNALGNRHITNNLRIILINNGGGAEFSNYNHPCYFLGKSADRYISAVGHFGNMSKHIVKHYVTDLGFEYFSANSKEQFVSVVDYFLSSQLSEKPIFFEIFTEPQNESDALKLILNVNKKEKTEDPKPTIMQKVKTSVAYHINKTLDALKIK